MEDTTITYIVLGSGVVFLALFLLMWYMLWKRNDNKKTWKFSGNEWQRI